MTLKLMLGNAACNQRQPDTDTHMSGSQPEVCLTATLPQLLPAAAMASLLLLLSTKVY
jgi:hypothetical protein